MWFYVEWDRGPSGLNLCIARNGAGAMDIILCPITYIHAISFLSRWHLVDDVVGSPLFKGWRTRVREGVVFEDHNGEYVRLIPRDPISYVSKPHSDIMVCLEKTSEKRERETYASIIPAPSATAKNCTIVFLISTFLSFPVSNNSGITDTVPT